LLSLNLAYGSCDLDNRAQDTFSQGYEQDSFIQNFINYPEFLDTDEDDNEPEDTSSCLFTDFEKAMIGSVTLIQPGKTNSFNNQLILIHITNLPPPAV